MGMVSHMRPVDVISVCNADGSIRPLRLRLEGEDKALVRVDVEQVLSIREVPYVGVEALIFRCRGRSPDRLLLFELKFLLRQHSWSIALCE